MANNENRTARFVGTLFLISNVTFLLGSVVFVESVLGAPDYLALLSTNRTQVVVGVLLELVNGLAYIGIAVLMFPLLRQRFESMALGYVALRIIEFVMQVAAAISPFILVTLGQEFAGGGALDSSSAQVLGASLLAGRYWSFEILYLIFSLSALMFYTMLYQTNLVPRFISVWGFVAAALVLTNTLLEILGINLGTGFAMLTGLPMLFNELFLGVWLVIKGFSPDASYSASPKAAISMG